MSTRRPPACPRPGRRLTIAGARADHGRVSASKRRGARDASLRAAHLRPVGSTHARSRATLQKQAPAPVPDFLSADDKGTALQHGHGIVLVVVHKVLADQARAHVKPATNNARATPPKQTPNTAAKVGGGSLCLVLLSHNVLTKATKQQCCPTQYNRGRDG